MNQKKQGPHLRRRAVQGKFIAVFRRAGAMILSIRLIDSLFLAWMAFVERHADQHGSGAAPLVWPAFEIGDDGAAGIVRAWAASRSSSSLLS